MTNWNDAGELREELAQLQLEFEEIGLDSFKISRMRRMATHIHKLAGVSEWTVYHNARNDAAYLRSVK